MCDTTNSSIVTVYMSSLASNIEIRKQQTRIQDVLYGSRIEFVVVDVSASKDHLAKMRDVVGNAKALAPQIARGDIYCGNYEDFEDAVECKTLHEFLKCTA